MLEKDRSSPDKNCQGWILLPVSPCLQSNRGSKSLWFSRDSMLPKSPPLWRHQINPRDSDTLSLKHTALQTCIFIHVHDLKCWYNDLLNVSKATTVCQRHKTLSFSTPAGELHWICKYFFQKSAGRQTLCYKIFFLFWRKKIDVWCIC